MAEKQLSDRAQALLKSLIETHIKDGQPVGSGKLVRSAGLNVSAATVRNIMSDLEGMGYLSSPHTSAGRLPTTAGYRFFVDSLLKINPLNDSIINELSHRLTPDMSSGDVIKSASSILSSLTQMVGVVALPQRNQNILKQIEFLSLEPRKVLVVLIINGNEVQNRIIQLDRDYSKSELKRVSNYLTEQFRGLDIDVARTKLNEEIEGMKSELDDLMASLLELGDKALGAKSPSDGLVLDGEAHLMDYDELSDVEKLRGLFNSFAEKRDILHVFDQCVSANGVQIFIGSESGCDVLDDCSIVTSPYSVDNSTVGVLGVIGPTRMAYSQVIPLVDITAKLVGSVLNSK